MKLWYKISIPSILVIAVIVFIVSFSIVNSLKKAVFREAFLKIDEAVVRNIPRYLSGENFLNPSGQASQKQFYDFSENIRDPAVVRFTVWSKERVILFSDLSSIIGVHSPDHPDLKQLFDTGTPFFIRKIKDTNTPIQSDAGEFLDVYIPIKVGGEVVGAAEIQAVSAAVIKPIAKQIQNIIYLLIAVSLVGLATIFLIIRYVIIRPLGRLEETADYIAGGGFDHPVTVHSSDEVGRLASNLEQMRLRLKALVENLEGEVRVRTRDLKEEQARLVATINTLPRGLMLLDINNNIVFLNSSLKRILGLEERYEPILADIEKKMAGVVDIRALCAQCQNEKKLVTIQELFWHNKFLQIFFAPVIMLRDSEEAIGTVILIGDITEEKVIERAKEELFAVASHELRTPLTAIRGNAEMLLDFFSEQFKNEDVRQMVGDIRDGSVRLIKIVNDFLDVSRLEGGKVIFKKERFDLTEVVKEIMRGYEKSFSEKNLYLRLKDGATPLPQALADKDRTKQVTSNLIDNAMKYTQKGGAEIEIREEDKFLAVRVHDTGIGISPQNQTLLFRKFQQAGEKILARDVSQSTGLGLYISKLIAETMDGTLSLEKSELGKGSTFRFAIPVATERGGVTYSIKKKLLGSES